MSNSEAKPDSPGPSRQAWYGLAVLIVATLFGFADRQILVLVTEPLKHDLHLGDVQIGALQGLGPGLFAAAATVPLGWLADRAERRMILFVCVVLWSLATAACGLAGSFPMLFAATIGIAIGESALGPLTYSLIPDLFPGDSRVRANFIFFGAVTVGAGVGLAAGGGVLALIEAHRSELPGVIRSLPAWRLAFFAVAAPGLLVAALIALIGKVGRRSASVARGSSIRVGAYFRRHWAALASLYASFGLYGVAIYAIYAWTPVAVIRVLHAPPATVGAGIGVAEGLGCLTGLLAAAASVKVWTRLAGTAGPLRALQFALVIGLAPTLLQLFATSPWQVFVLVGVQFAFLTSGASLLPTLLQDLSPEHMRGRIIALATLAYVALSAFSPILVGGVSEAFATAPRALLWAVVIVTAPALALAALFLKLAEPSFRRTLEQLRAEAAEAPGEGTEAI